MTSKHTDPDLIYRQLVSSVKPGSHKQLVNVWMEYPVHKSNRWALVWVLIRDLDMNLPCTTSKWSCDRMLVGEL